MEKPPGNDKVTEPQIGEAMHPVPLHLVTKGCVSDVHSGPTHAIINIFFTNCFSRL